MYKAISKQMAQEILAQIQVARAYAQKITNKDEEALTIATLRREGLYETAEHVRFLSYQAVTLGMILKLPETFRYLEASMEPHMTDAIDGQIPQIYFDKSQVIHLCKLDKVMGVNSKTCELYVYSFKPGWRNALIEHRNRFSLKEWAYTFSLQKYGMYIHESKW